MIIKVPKIWDYENHVPEKFFDWFKKPVETVRGNDVFAQIRWSKAAIISSAIKQEHSHALLLTPDQR